MYSVANTTNGRLYNAVVKYNTIGLVLSNANPNRI